MKVVLIATRRRGLSAVSFFPAPPKDIPGAEYEDERVLIDRVILGRCNINIGTELSENDLKELVYVSECYRAKQRAVYYLSQGDLSAKGLNDKLKRNFSERASAFAVAQMIKKGYLDDERYAERLIGQLQAKNLSQRAIVNKLYLKGISNEIAKKMLERDELAPSDAERAESLIISKYKNKISDEVGIKRTFAALQRRGFSYSDIKKAFERIKEDAFEGEEIC